MLEIGLNLEQTAAGFKPIALIVPGLAAVLVGLFVWLGGLGFRKILVVVVGAVSGAGCGFFIAGANIILAMLLAVVAVVIAVIFERIFIGILTVVLAVGGGFVVLAGPYIKNTVNLAAVKDACLQMPLFAWAIIAALAVIFTAAAFFLRRFTSALCCAMLGTILIFAGMISLLLCKGAMPISCIGRKTPFYAAVFIAMITFGTVEQLLLCKDDGGGEKLTEKKETGEGECKN